MIIMIMIMMIIIMIMKIMIIMIIMIMVIMTMIIIIIMIMKIMIMIMIIMMMIMVIVMMVMMIITMIMIIMMIMMITMFCRFNCSLIYQTVRCRRYAFPPSRLIDFTRYHLPWRILLCIATANRKAHLSSQKLKPFLKLVKLIGQTEYLINPASESSLQSKARHKQTNRYQRAQSD